MASVKYGSIITDIKGKLGGNVYQGGPYGPIIRSNFKGSTAKNYVPTSTNLELNSLAIAWNSLTIDDKNTWSTNSYLYPVKDKFGNNITLSGYACFVMLNYPLLVLNASLNTQCPTPQGIPDTYSFAPTISVSSMEFLTNCTPNTTTANTGIIITAYEPFKNDIARGFFRRLRARVRAFISSLVTPDIYSDYDEQMYGKLKPEAIGLFVPFSWQVVNIHTGEKAPEEWCFPTIET
jgi:hypothetical protein